MRGSAGQPQAVAAPRQEGQLEAVLLGRDLLDCTGVGGGGGAELPCLRRETTWRKEHCRPILAARAPAAMARTRTISRRSAGAARASRSASRARSRSTTAAGARVAKSLASSASQALDPAAQVRLVGGCRDGRHRRPPRLPRQPCRGASGGGDQLRAVAVVSGSAQVDRPHPCQRLEVVGPRSIASRGGRVRRHHGQRQPCPGRHARPRCAGCARRGPASRDRRTAVSAAVARAGGRPGARRSGAARRRWRRVRRHEARPDLLGDEGHERVEQPQHRGKRLARRRARRRALSPSRRARRGGGRPSPSPGTSRSSRSRRTRTRSRRSRRELQGVELRGGTLSAVGQAGADPALGQRRLARVREGSGRQPSTKRAAFHSLLVKLRAAVSLACVRRWSTPGDVAGHEREAQRIGPDLVEIISSGSTTLPFVLLIF